MLSDRSASIACTSLLPTLLIFDVSYMDITLHHCYHMTLFMSTYIWKYIGLLFLAAISFIFSYFMIVIFFLIASYIINFDGVVYTVMKNESSAPPQAFRLPPGCLWNPLSSECVVSLDNNGDVYMCWLHVDCCHKPLSKLYLTNMTFKHELNQYYVFTAQSMLF